jgi:hypothetical protein
MVRTDSCATDLNDQTRVAGVVMTFSLTFLVLMGFFLVRMAVVARLGPRNGQAVGSIRVTSGDVQGLSAKWKHGRVFVRPGLIEFRPAGPGGLRFPKGKPFAVHLSGVEPGYTSPGLEQIWSVNPFMKVATAHTPTGVLNIAASKKALDALADSTQAC